VCIPFVLWWGVNSGCENSLAWVALGSYQASERRLGIVPLFLRWTISCVQTAIPLHFMILVTYNGDVWPQRMEISEISCNLSP
jgi:hypothetical protein